MTKFRIVGMAVLLLLFDPAHAFAVSGSGTYAYDVLGRPTSVTYSDGKVITFTYDAVGNRTSRVVTGAP